MEKLNGLHGLYNRDMKLYIQDVLNTELPNELQDFSDSEKKEWLYEQTRKRFPSLPESLVNLTVGFVFAGDCGRPEDERPNWLDLDLLEKGQAFIKENMFGISYANSPSFFLVFSFPDVLSPLILTRKSSTPYTSFRRYLSTASRFMIWYGGDIWTKGSHANDNIMQVRKIHLNIREKLLKTPDDKLEKAGIIENSWSPTHKILLQDFQETCPIPASGQCPFLDITKSSDNKCKGMSQSEMAMTQFAFIGLIVLYPTYFGIRETDKNGLYGYCHFWRCIGYLLGIDDEYNLCRGTLKEITARCKDYLELWIKPNLRNVTAEWEHMMRCMIEGFGYHSPLPSYEASLLSTMQMIDVKIPRFESQISLRDRIKCKLMRITFYVLATIPGIHYLLSKLVSDGMDEANNFTAEKHKELWRKSAHTWKFSS